MGHAAVGVRPTLLAQVTGRPGSRAAVSLSATLQPSLARSSSVSSAAAVLSLSTLSEHPLAAAAAAAGVEAAAATVADSRAETAAGVPPLTLNPEPLNP